MTLSEPLPTTTISLAADEIARHKDYRNARQGRPRTAMQWDEREFIAWDGEGIKPETYRAGPWPTAETNRMWTQVFLEKNGELPLDKDGVEFSLQPVEPQPYVLLANSKGDRIVQREGIPTLIAFEFLLHVKSRYPKSVFVGFGLNYDFAQILKDLPFPRLRFLYETNVTHWGKYRIEWRPRRWLRITHKPSKRTVSIYDVFGFFQSSFLVACEKYLGKNDPDLSIIREGKAARNVFTWEELDSFIIPYNDTELRMLVKMMDILRDDLHAIDLNLASDWYGPGAIANRLLNKRGIKKYMAKSPEEVQNAAQYAYAGGRFEQFKLGRHTGNVFEYDIRSAYPAAATRLPILSEGTWEYAETFEPETFGVWNISYRQYPDNDKPQPLFCRSSNGSVSFPRESTGWYWGPEAALVPNDIRHGFVWRPRTDTKPFAFVQEMFEQRRLYKQQGLACERAIKLALNSIYGKLAQIIGARGKQAPGWHQLEWAGWITSYVRAMIYKAILLRPDSIIAAETDAVFSTEPLPLDIGEGLGQWEESTFKEITYLQSGFYYAINEDDTVICRYRGLDRDRETGQPIGLPYRHVLDHLSNRGESTHWKTQPLFSTSTRFINIGMALRTGATFRTWETATKAISLDQGSRKSKRYHMNCVHCQEGKTLADCLHPLTIGGHSGYSYPHVLPWVLDDLNEQYKHYLEMESAELWQ